MSSSILVTDPDASRPSLDQQVGVVDILPSCLSSVYCFYDPDFKQLSLGKLTALWEIDWVRQASRFRCVLTLRCVQRGPACLSCACVHPFYPHNRSLSYSPDLRFYYLGFYIHTCPKMRYKGAYEPSELLCPVTLRWTPLSDCRAILDRRSYARLAPLEDGEDVDMGADGGGGNEGQEQVQEAAAGADGGEGDSKDDAGDGDEEEEEEEGGDDSDEAEEEDARFGLHVPLTEAEMSALEQVAMDVGPLAALPPRSQQILLPILREFVAHVTPALVPRMLIKLRH